jgi:hypothetical protein
MRLIPERFADRLPAKELRMSTEDRNAGEWGSAISILAAGLHRMNSPISSREKAELQELIETFRPATDPSGTRTRYWDRTTQWLDSLTVVQSLTEKEMIRQLKAIPKRFADRLTPADVDRLTVRPEEEEPGVWEEIGDDLMQVLRQRQVRISEAERKDLWMILDALDLPRTELMRLPAA